MTPTGVRVLGGATLAAVVCALVALAYLHLAEARLSPISRPVSEYGITPHRGGYRVLTISMGVAGLLAAGGLGVTVQPPPLVVLLALGCFAVARLLISWVPMDAPAAAATGRGQAHTVIAILTFASAAVAALNLSPALRGAQPGLAALSSGLGWLMVACGVALLAARLLPLAARLFGLIERVLYGAILTWLGAVAIALR